jgi:tetratricopeptide (TPR) repeat protein
MLLSTTVIIPIVLTITISIILTFVPLAGALGFEYAAVTGLVLSFISVFISAELMGTKYKNYSAGKRLSDRVSSIFIINLILLGVVYLIGLLSSLFKRDCFIKEGSVFFLLIPVVSVFFSASLGLLAGFVLKKKGFIAGVLILIGIIAYTLYRLYSGVSLFVYDPLFGFFPGPLYDEAIPVTLTLVAYRGITILWGLLFLILLTLVNGFSYRRVGVWEFVKLLVVGITLIVACSHEQELGISYSREYITGKILPASVETEHFIIYYDPASLEAKNIALIAGDHEWRYAEVSKYLDTDSGGKIRSYIYPDEETRKRIVGAGETTIANPIHREIHLVYDAFPQPILKHELTHVVAGSFGTRLLRMTPKVGLLEGLAVATDWSDDPYNPHQWSKALIREGITPRIEDIVGFGFWYAPAGLSYTLMGSFSRYLIDMYGIEKFKTLYRTGNFSVYGKSLPELAAGWKKFLEGVNTPEEAYSMAKARFAAPSIFTATCPRKVAELRNEGYRYYAENNFYRARAAFGKALKYNGNDPSILNGLAYSYYYQKDYKEAAGAADSGKSLPEVDRAVLDNLKGNALWQAGKTKAAEDIFRSVRVTPLPDDLKREIDIKLSAIETDGSAEESVREFFSTRDRVLQAVSLSESIFDTTDYAPPYYLLGRLLFNMGEYERAVPYLTMAEYLGLPSAELADENLKILGISLFASVRYDDAYVIFSRLASGGDEEKRDYALDFLKRIEWARTNNLK